MCDGIRSYRGATESTGPMSEDEHRGLMIYYADTLREIRDVLRTMANQQAEIKKTLKKMQEEKADDGK